MNLTDESKRKILTAGILLWIPCAMLSVVATIPLLALLLCVRTEVIRFCKADILLLLLFIYELFTCLLSVYSPNTVRLVLRFAVLVVACVVLRVGWSNRLAHWINVLYAVLLVGTLLSFAVHRYVFQDFPLALFTEFKHFYRPWGVSSNDFCLLLLILSAFAIYELLTDNNRVWQILALVNVVLLYVCGMLSFSRGMYLALGILLLVVVALFCLHRIPVFKFCLLFIAITVSIAVAGGLAGDPVCRTLQGEVTESQQKSTESRIRRFSEVVCLSQEFPLFGCGRGNYAVVSMDEQTKNGTVFTPYTSNTFLQVLLETGAFGMLLFVVLIVCVCCILCHGVSANSLWSVAILPVFFAVLVRETFFSTWLNSDAVLTVSAILYTIILKENE